MKRLFTCMCLCMCHPHSSKRAHHQPTHRLVQTSPETIVQHASQKFGFNLPCHRGYRSTAGVCGSASKPARQPQPLNILVTNDDGCRASTINILFDALAAAGHKPVMVAPAEDVSGSGAAITFAGWKVRHWRGCVSYWLSSQGHCVCDITSKVFMAAAYNLW